MRAAIIQELEKLWHLIMVERSAEETPVDAGAADVDKRHVPKSGRTAPNANLNEILSFGVDWKVTESDSILSLREPALDATFPTDPRGAMIDAFSTGGENLKETISRLRAKTGVAIFLEEHANKLPVAEVVMNLRQTTLRSALAELARRDGYDYLRIPSPHPT